MKKVSSNRAGFSLVEVVASLGLFAFCVVAIVGLFGIGLTAARSVATECAAVSVAESLYGAWQAQQDATKPVTLDGIVESLPALSSAETGDLYFDESGAEAESADSAVFQVRYSIDAAPVPEGAPLFATVRLEVRWPPGAPPQSAQTRVYKRSFLKNPL